MYYKWIKSIMKTSQEQYKFLYEYTLWIGVIALAFINIITTQIPKFILLSMLFGVDSYFNVNITNAEKKAKYYIPPIVLGAGYTVLAIYYPQAFIIDLLAEAIMVLGQCFFEANDRLSLQAPIILLSGLVMLRGLPKMPYIHRNIHGIAVKLFVAEKVASIIFQHKAEKPSSNVHFCRRLDSESAPAAHYIH